MRRTAALATGLAGITAIALAAPALAAPPKPFTQTSTFTDATPDPSGNTESGNENHCSGLLPQETPISVKIPGPGDVDVTLSGVTGDWALQIQDAAGNVIGGTDVNPPEAEATSVRLKKAATIKVLPCNLAGAPTAKVTIAYTYRK